MTGVLHLPPHCRSRGPTSSSRAPSLLNNSQTTWTRLRYRRKAGSGLRSPNRHPSTGPDEGRGRGGNAFSDGILFYVFTRRVTGSSTLVACLQNGTTTKHVRPAVRCSELSRIDDDREFCLFATEQQSRFSTATLRSCLGECNQTVTAKRREAVRRGGP